MARPCREQDVTPLMPWARFGQAADTFMPAGGNDNMTDNPDRRSVLLGALAIAIATALGTRPAA